MLDLSAAYATLRGGKANGPWLRTWLPETHVVPEAFWEALYAFHFSRQNAVKSRYRKAYDFYHDCVIIHLGSGKPAFVLCESGLYEEVSYDVLHERCAALAAAWRRAGVVSRQSVCVVLPVCVELVVTVLTALWLGLVVSTLHPYGATFVRNRLLRLKADWVATRDPLPRVLGLPSTPLLPVAASRSQATPGTFSYSPSEPAMALMSPFQASASAPIVLTAKALHGSLVRDGLLVFGLDANDVLAAPGFDPLQFQPSLMLTALMSGAAYAELRLAEVETDLGLIERARVSVLGIGASLRERLRAQGVGGLKPTVRAWFRSLSEALDLNRWNAVSHALTSSKVTGFNIMMNAATGGVELFSPRSVGPAASLNGWPVPGRQWQLADVGTGELAALTGTGVYAPFEADEPVRGLPRILLSCTDEASLFAGTIDVGPNGQVYPGDEVVEVVASVPAVRHASVVVAPGDGLNDARTVLLVFVDSSRDSDGTMVLPVGIPEVQRRIAREMGERFVPDRIEIFPLRPRVIEGKVDDVWCRRQYLSGALTRKARSEMFVLLARIGYIVASEQPVE
jgi:hypothetical protein